MCGSGETKTVVRSKSQRRVPVPPTGSTFINHTTVRPGVCNLNGHTDPQAFMHQHQGTHATFGKPPGGYRSSHQSTGPSHALSSLPPVKRHEYTGPRKENVVTLKDAPILKLSSNVNFIAENRKANIELKPAPLKTETLYSTKKCYGQVPVYLQKTKEKLAEEAAALQKLRDDEEAEILNRELKGEQLEEVRKELVRKYEEVNREYQTITHITKIDSLGLKRKKETCEAILKKKKKDMALLNHQKVIVVDK